MQVVGLMDGPRSREGALSRRTGRGEAFGGEEEENGVNGVQSGLILAAERDGVLPEYEDLWYGLQTWFNPLGIPGV